MGKLLSDLTKALLITKNKSNKQVSSMGSLIVTQSQCPECEYNGEEYDVDQYCAECDGQSNFTPKAGTQESPENSPYDQILALVEKLSQQEKSELLQTLEEELKVR